jgi:acyl-CoA synthetase (AMP-forming)/AMP-acid ligase II
LGEEVAAYIQLKDDSVTKEDIIAFCKEGLARYKLPKYIKFTDEFPKTVTGKIQKFLLREQAMEDFPELKEELAAMQ